MANASYIISQFGGLKAEERAAHARVWEHAIGRNGGITMGVVEHQARSENLSGHFFEATTPSTANTEFSIDHGLGTTPRMALSVLPLNVVNAQTVNLTVTRVADAQRLYLSSPSTAATMYVYVE